MNPHGPRELKPLRRQNDDPLDGKWAHKPGRQFPGFHLEGQVLGEKPHPLADLVRWGRGSVTISLCSVATYGMH